jgi:undecaprenyl-diphosphatase
VPRTILKRTWARLTTLERHEITWLLVGLAACVLLLVFLRLANAVMAGSTLAFDTRILRAFRTAEDPAKLIGPPWIESALFDLTALGGPIVLGLVVLAVAGFLVLQARYHSALAILLTAASGEVLNSAMKSLFMRPRPDVVPHVRIVYETSFPSGHAMNSAIIYLTLGAMLMRITDRRRTKLYCLTLAVLATVLVGTSRVYLGVHYPTDVIAGWAVGLAWASVCWLVERRVDVRAGIREERRRSA